MLPKSVLLVFILSVVVDVYSQSSNTPVLKSSKSNVCSDSQTVSDWILEAPSRLKTNEKSANKTVESATGGHGQDGAKPRRRIVLMKFRGRRRLRTRASKTAPETEYRLDLINKFTNNAEVLFVAHYPNRSECGMGTFSSYEGSNLDKGEGVKQKDECFWSIESSLSVKGKKQFKYITPKCGCFNFSYYIAYKPGDETVIDRPDPVSTDPFKRLTRTYCIAKGGFKSSKSKHKKKKRLRGGKKAKKDRKSERAEKIRETLTRSRKDARSQPGKAPRLPYSEYSPYRRSEYSPYRENQMFLNEVGPSRSDMNNLNEHEESQNAIKHYEYYGSGGFTENSEDIDYDDDDDEEAQEEIHINVITEEGIEEPLVEAEVKTGLSEGEDVQMNNEVEGKDEVVEEFYVDESERNVDVKEESSDEKIEMDINESGEESEDDESSDEDDDDNEEHAESSENKNKIDENESSEESKEDENESKENDEEEFKTQPGENEDKNDNAINEENEITDNTSNEDESEGGIHEQKHKTDDSCESDESDENSAEDESEKESVKTFNVLSESHQGETEPTRENRSSEESQESSEEEREPQIISRVLENERLSRKENRRRKHFGLRMDRNRGSRLQRRRRRKQEYNKEIIKAVRICCNQGTFRKKLILHNKLENIVDFAETCENVPHSLSFRIARIYKVKKEICVYKYKECCNKWSLLANKPRLDRFRHLRILH